MMGEDCICLDLLDRPETAVAGTGQTGQGAGSPAEPSTLNPQPSTLNLQPETRAGGTKQTGQTPEVFLSIL